MNKMDKMTEEKIGFIFDIQHFSIHDGPGIRTTVFLKGCPLRCAWCHNPESQLKAAELAYFQAKCIGCGNCVSACPNGCHALSEGGHELCRTNCVVCGKCTKSCFSNALTIIGRMAAVTEVVDEVMKDSLFYSVSGGGMTVSGGEPMFQPGFTLELLRAVKGLSIHTCIEHCGFCAPEHLINIVPYTDLFLFDLKAAADVHELWTGVPLGPILNSLHIIDDAGGKIILRCPLIPGVNMNDGHTQNIARIAASLKNITEINIEPYHPIGVSKCEATGREPKYCDPKMLERNEAEKWAEKLRRMTDVRVTVI